MEWSGGCNLSKGFQASSHCGIHVGDRILVLKRVHVFCTEPVNMYPALCKQLAIVITLRPLSGRDYAELTG
jgi:hypothetical protein